MEAESLKDIAKQIEATGKPRQITVRQLLNAISQERRGKYVMRSLRIQLRRCRLKTDPDIENIHIDVPVSLTLGPRLGRPPRGQDRNDGSNIADVIHSEISPPDTLILTEDSASGAVEETEIRDTTSDSLEDVVITVRQGIPSAGMIPTTVRRNDTVEHALTLMTDQNLEYLVVMQGNRGRVEGIFSWQSYGQAIFAGRKPKTVGDCLSQEFGILNEERPLFDAVREIIRRGIVAVNAHHAQDSTLCGVVTARDVAEVFVELAEPFLFLGQIENHLRELVNRMKLSEPELRSLVDERDDLRAAKATKVEDLSLGELIRSIQKPELWNGLKLGYEHTILLNRLDQVRLIRNKVMHFDSGGILEIERRYLEETRRILQKLFR